MVRKIATAGVLVWLVLALASPAQSQSCGCEVSDQKEAAYNALLSLSAADQAAVIHRHLPWGVPVSSTSATGERMLVQADYVTMYDDDLRVPIWTAHRMIPADLVDRNRRECFRRDPRIPPAASAFCADYDEPIYDRGHLVPNSDMNRSESAMINSYMFSNMTPQECAFNRGTWQVFESLIRHWVSSRAEVYVITGSVFDRDGNGQRDADTAAQRMRARNGSMRVAVPTHQYKILAAPLPSGFISVLALMVPNHREKIPQAQIPSFLASDITTIDAIEGVTGLNFFTEMEATDPQRARAIERFKAPRLWSVTVGWPSSLAGGCSGAQ